MKQFVRIKVKWIFFNQNLVGFYDGNAHGQSKPKEKKSLLNLKWGLMQPSCLQNELLLPSPKDIRYT